MTNPDLSDLPEGWQDLGEKLRLCANVFLQHNDIRKRMIDKGHPIALWVQEYYFDRKYTEDEGIKRLVGLLKDLAKDDQPEQ